MTENKCGDCRYFEPQPKITSIKKRLGVQGMCTTSFGLVCKTFEGANPVELYCELYDNSYRSRIAKWANQYGTYCFEPKTSGNK